MNFTFVLFAVIFVGILLTAAMGMRLLLPLVAQHFKGSGGDWNALAAGYATTRPPPAQLFTRQHVVVGQLLYRNSMIVGFDDEGLYLAPGFPLSLLGRPPVTTITVPMALFAAMRPALTAATTFEGLQEVAL